MKSVWSIEAVEELLILIKKYDKQLHDRKTRKTTVYKLIANALQEMVGFLIRYNIMI